MGAARWLREVVLHLAGLAVTVLPERSKRWEWTAALPMGRLHVLSGAAETLIGVSLFLHWMLAFVNRFTAEYGYTYLASRPELTHGLIGSMGVLGYISFLFTLKAWFAVYLVAEGMVRALEVLLLDRRPGMLVVAAADWLGRRVMRWVGHVRLQHALGPKRPDRVERLAGQDGEALALWSVHGYPWRQGQVIRFADGLFVLCETGLARDGRHHAHRFRFRALDPGEIIRGEVGTYPPAFQDRRGGERTR